jgi:hypothetical protein
MTFLILYGESWDDVVKEGRRRNDIEGKNEKSWKEKSLQFVWFEREEKFIHYHEMLLA